MANSYFDKQKLLSATCIDEFNLYLPNPKLFVLNLLSDLDLYASITKELNIIHMYYKLNFKYNKRQLEDIFYVEYFPKISLESIIKKPMLFMLDSKCDYYIEYLRWIIDVSLLIPKFHEIPWNNIDGDKHLWHDEKITKMFMPYFDSGVCSPIKCGSFRKCKICNEIDGDLLSYIIEVIKITETI